MKKALAILTYARPRYLELVLPSILQQKIFGRPVDEIYDIHLFQDGLWSEESEENTLGHTGAKRLLDLLAPRYPLTVQPSNLGVALHFDFVERLLFLKKSYDFVAFFEDDLILAPGYMQALDLMSRTYGSDERVSLISAHPVSPYMNIEQQHASIAEYSLMDHNWGFGISRSAWQRRQPFVDCYLELMRNSSYRERDVQAIAQWQEACGFKAGPTSQDYIKSCASAALGSVRLSTAANFGLPIGRTGLHCRPEHFNAMGFDRTIICDKLLTHLDDLTDDIFQQLYSAQSSRFLRKRSSFCRREWSQRLLAGDFHPSRLLGEITEGSLAHSKINDEMTTSSNDGGSIDSGHAAETSMQNTQMKSVKAPPTRQL